MIKLLLVLHISLIIFMIVNLTNYEPSGYPDTFFSGKLKDLKTDTKQWVEFGEKQFQLNKNIIEKVTLIK